MSSLAPGFAQRISVEGKQKSPGEEQNCFVKGSRDRKKTYYDQSPQRARNSTVLCQDADYTNRALYRLH
jgi:hypothetical protein